MNIGTYNAADWYFSAFMMSAQPWLIVSSRNSYLYTTTHAERVAMQVVSQTIMITINF